MENMNIEKSMEMYKMKNCNQYNIVRYECLKRSGKVWNVFFVAVFSPKQKYFPLENIYSCNNSGKTENLLIYILVRKQTTVLYAYACVLSEENS